MANQSSSSVLHNRDDFAFLGDAAIAELKRMAARSPLGRARICLHHSTKDLVQEMILAVTCRSQFPPHRHRDKTESFHVLDGELAVIIFDDVGTPVRGEILTPHGRGGFPLFRMSVMAWHAVLPLTSMVVYHEVTTGPFVEGEAEVADFCPSAGEGLTAFLDNATRITCKRSSHCMSTQ